jgi:hypothetical protein
VNRALVGKGRYQSRSQREQDRVQSQIHTFAIRYWADEELKQQAEVLRCLGQRLESPMQSREQIAQDLGEVNLDRFVETCFEIVERVMQV